MAGPMKAFPAAAAGTEATAAVLTSAPPEQPSWCRELAALNLTPRALADRLDILTTEGLWAREAEVLAWLRSVCAF